MSPNSDKTTNESNRSTATKRTDATSAAIHLARLADLTNWLERTEGLTYASLDAKGKRRFAESVRWVIKREQSRS